MIPHIPVATSRRKFLTQSANGFGALALSSLLANEAAANHLQSPISNPQSPISNLQSPISNLQSPISNLQSPSPLAPKPPHFAAKAKAVIYLFMVGGPSHMETFDPKPVLDQMHGQQLPKSFGEVKGQFVKPGTPLLHSHWKFKQYGQSGLPVSELFPHVASCIDDIAVLRSCYTDSAVHAPAMYQMLTSRVLAGHPSLGSWVTYGLGTESQNLPAYCVLTQPEGLPEGGAPMWGNGYLPTLYQGTQLRGGKTPILHLDPPKHSDAKQQRHLLDYLRRMNEMNANADDSEMAARVASYELAFRMQQHAPEAVDVSQESAATKKLYGLDSPHTREFGTRCLLARRLVERGVRFVLLFSGGGPVSTQWDAHDLIKENHDKMALWTDQPIAGLLKDLKSRGMFEETLVVWGTEFGRTPVSENGKGRDHNHEGFSMWLAGGGVKGGQAIGMTDELGFKCVGERYHPRDINATILHLMGLDQWKLTFKHNGRDERLTDFGGNVIQPILA